MLTRSLQDEMVAYSKRCERLEHENHELRVLIDAFSASSGDASASLGSHFDKELRRMTALIDARLLRVQEIEKEAKTARIVFPTPPKKVTSKTQLLVENDKLIRTALHREQISIVERLKLALFHDHRHCRDLKELAERVKRGERIDDRDAELERRKDCMRNLKAAIQAEKWRIAALKSQDYEVNTSATIVQRTWRGYWQRYVSKHAAEAERRDAAETEERRRTDIPVFSIPLQSDDERAHSALSIDSSFEIDNQLFEVTGVMEADPIDDNSDLSACLTDTEDGSVEDEACGNAVRDTNLYETQQEVRPESELELELEPELEHESEPETPEEADSEVTVPEAPAPAQKPHKHILMPPTIFDDIGLAHRK